MGVVVTNVLRIPLLKFHDGNNAVIHIGILAKICGTNGKDTDAHKLQYFPTTLRGRNASWFTCYETTNLVATSRKVQHAFISRFNHMRKKKKNCSIFERMKQWKHEMVEDYYDKFLQLHTIIPQ